MSTKELINLYVDCFPGVKNEMLMRQNTDSLHGRILRDDQVVDGYIHGLAWILFNKEDVVLNFPETYGRYAKATLYDMWDNVRKIYTKRGGYKLSICNGAAGKLIIEVACANKHDEKEFQQAFDVMQDFTVTDLGVGANDYEDYQTLAPAMFPPRKDLEPTDINAKHFFAIANAVFKANPFSSYAKNKRVEYLFNITERMSADELETIKEKAQNKYKLE